MCSFTDSETQETCTALVTQEQSERVLAALGFIAYRNPTITDDELDSILSKELNLLPENLPEKFHGLDTYDKEDGYQSQFRSDLKDREGTNKVERSTSHAAYNGRPLRLRINDQEFESKNGSIRIQWNRMITRASKERDT